jgi:hypothetical protein
MQSFTILSPLELCSREEMEIILRSFIDLYSTVTNKHRKKMRLLLVGMKSDFKDLVAYYQQEVSAEAIQVVDLNSKVWSESSVLLMPNCHQKSYIPRSLSAGVPILTYDEIPQKQYIDNSCGMLVKSHSKEHDISQFATFLNMLYFDPEARKMLQKGALRCFDSYFDIQKEILSEEAVLSQVA